MKYVVPMGSGSTIICPLSFIKIGSGIQKLIGVGIHRHRQQGDLISLLLFFQNKESRLTTPKQIRSGSLLSFAWDRSQR
jgi:hypothetical protein